MISNQFIAGFLTYGIMQSTAKLHPITETHTVSKTFPLEWNPCLVNPNSFPGRTDFEEICSAIYTEFKEQYEFVDLNIRFEPWGTDMIKAVWAVTPIKYREVTLKQLEDELGYKIKIVTEENENE